MTNEVDRTLWVGNLSEKATEELLYELFLQAGPLDKVIIPKEKDGVRQKSFAFVTFSHDVSVPYTIQMMDGLSLFGRALRLQSRPGSIHQKQPAQGQFQNTDNRGPPTPTNQYNIIPPNPYGMNQPVTSVPLNPYGMNQPVTSVPLNPYGMNKPVTSHPPEFHRSNTWHGNEQSPNSRQLGRDYNEHRNDHGRSRGHYSGRDGRDRSGSRHRDDAGNSSDHDRDSYGSSPKHYSARTSNVEDFESKRHNVLQRHERAVQHYRRNTSQKPYHHNKYDKY